MILAAWGMLAACALGLAGLVDPEPFSSRFWFMVAYVGGMAFALIVIIERWK
jgi:hypothetical protein